MLNLNHIIKDLEDTLKQVPGEHKAFIMKMLSQVKANIREGKPNDEIINKIKEYVSNQ